MTADQLPLVYAAHPLTTYGTAMEARALKRLAELLPHAQIINPANSYADNTEWLTDWPRLLPQLAAFIVFGDRDGGIGTGCLHELADAWWRGIPVAMLNDQGACSHVAALRIFSPGNGTYRRTGILIPGGEMRVGRLLR